MEKVGELDTEEVARVSVFFLFFLHIYLLGLSSDCLPVL